MAPVTHQTIKLSRGKHRSPAHGACVMELASMLAGESFSDHPAAVCPVIGSFLRAYNDSIDDDRRQDLYPYAAKVVGSRSKKEVQRMRSARLTAWASESSESRWIRLLPLWLRALSVWCHPDDIGTCAVHAMGPHDGSTHRRALNMIDELLAIGGREQAEPKLPAVSEPFVTA